MKFKVNKTLFIYAITLAIAAFLFEWLEYQYAIKVLGMEVYTIIVAGSFTVLGVWLGSKIFVSENKTEFEVNQSVINALGLTQRELQVLHLLALGETNKAIAEQLFVAPSTIKTHVLNIYKKLDVERRTQAIQKARELQIIP